MKSEPLWQYIFWQNKSLYVWMYVCIEVALRGDAHGIGRSNWAKGEGPIEIVGPISQPRGTIGTSSLTPDYTCTFICAF